MTRIVAISAGKNHTCAIKTGGAVWCWGLDFLGALGNGPANDGQYSTNPVPVAVTGGASSLAAGREFTCAATTAGKAMCWGYGLWGQLGNNEFLITNPGYLDAPVFVKTGTGSTDVTGVSQVAIMSGSHACAIISGAARCWGRNHKGQLGDGTTANKARVNANAGAAATVGVGMYHTCSVQSDGVARCWGDNTYGQLGLPLTTTSRLTPATINPPL